MENEVIRLQLQEQLARLEGQLETCEKNIRDFTDKIEETENDMSKARDMHDRYMDRVAAMNSYNDRISQIDNRYVISHYEEEDGPLTPLG